MGFTIAEIRTLLHGFSAETPAWARWQALARGKLPEINALIRKAEGMKQLLEASLACDCLTLDECAAALQTTIVNDMTPLPCSDESVALCPPSTQRD